MALRKVDEQRARKAYSTALRKIPKAELLAAWRHANARCAERPRYAPNPARWLRGERWNDPEEQHEDPQSDPAPEPIARGDELRIRWVVMRDSPIVKANPRYLEQWFTKAEIVLLRQLDEEERPRGPIPSDRQLAEAGYA